MAAGWPELSQNSQFFSNQLRGVEGNSSEYGSDLLVRFMRFSQWIVHIMVFRMLFLRLKGNKCA
jgi:hypothetical protein